MLLREALQQQGFPLVVEEWMNECNQQPLEEVSELS